MAETLAHILGELNMKLLPFENIIYRTNLPNEDIRNRLNDIIEPKKKFSFGESENNLTKKYKGEFKDSYFNIARKINYWNSSLPRIKGVIYGDKNGSIIKVKMRLHIFPIVFLIIWNSIVGIIFLLMLLTSISENEFNPIILGPIGMIVFVYLLSLIGFKFESKKSKNDFAELFDSKTKNN